MYKVTICNPVDEGVNYGDHDEIVKLALFNLIMAAQTSALGTSRVKMKLLC